jgi:hypothetical protein
MSASRIALLANLTLALPLVIPLLTGRSALAQTAGSTTMAMQAAPYVSIGSDVDVLIQKAKSAEQRDRCYLYARAVRLTADLAEAQVASGDREAANRALLSLESYTSSLETGLSGKDKKLKDAEILLRESAFRLKAAMLGASIDDRPAMASALEHVNAAESQVMGAVFAH